MWAFQGVDYKKGKLNPGVSGFIEPPRRERGQKSVVMMLLLFWSPVPHFGAKTDLLFVVVSARSYNEKEYYRNVLYSTTGGPGKRPGAARPPKQPAVHPHQFFPKRLYELIDKETNAWKQAEMIKERRAAEGGFVMDVDQADEEVDGLTAEEEEEKKQLLEKHNEFLEWSKREYLAFLKGCEKYGRTAYADIAKEVESKSEDSVKRYAAIFWKRGKELSDWDKVVGTIERGEQRLKRRDEVIELLHKKVSSTKDPWKSLKIPYAGATKSRYTEEEDIFLLCALDQVGYGNWEELKNVVKNNFQFRFDWYLKSRSASELQKRCEALIKILEKEAGDKEPAKVRLNALDGLRLVLVLTNHGHAEGRQEGRRRGQEPQKAWS
jgi:SWI/SNF-related matrix-associated actin-dependent regulator of chromatin subfamily A member 5